MSDEIHKTVAKGVEIMTDTRHDYARCTECSVSNAITVVELFGQTVAFRRFNADHTDMRVQDDDEWYCPHHAHIGMGMDRDEFEELRDSNGRLHTE
jgi:hypothetical protein